MRHETRSQCLHVEGKRASRTLNYLEAIDILEGDLSAALHAGAVPVAGGVASVGVLSLAAELDLRRDIGLAVVHEILAIEGRGQVARRGGEGRGDVKEVKVAEVTAGGGLDESSVPGTRILERRREQ